MAFDSAPPETSENETPSSPEGDSGMPESAEGETLSLDVFGDKEPTVGEMVTLKVTAVDPQNGTVTVMMPASRPAAAAGGIAAKAAAMDETS